MAPGRGLALPNGPRSIDPACAILAYCYLSGSYYIIASVSLRERSPYSMSHPVAISDNSFQSEVVDSSVPVLVDFWAEWCGPCKMIAPILETIAEEYPDSLKIAKLDVDR